MSVKSNNGPKVMACLAVAAAISGYILLAKQTGMQWVPAYFSLMAIYVMYMGFSVWFAKFKQGDYAVRVLSVSSVVSFFGAIFLKDYLDIAMAGGVLVNLAGIASLTLRQRGNGA